MFVDGGLAIVLCEGFTRVARGAGDRGRCDAVGALIAWWSQNSRGGRHIFAGNNLTELGSDDARTMDEFRLQVQLGRDQAALGSRGDIYFHVGPLLANQDGVTDVFAAELYSTPALTPAIAAQVNVAVEPPIFALQSEGAQVFHVDPASLRAWVVFRAEGERWVIDRVVPATEAEIARETGVWAIRAAGRHGSRAPACACLCNRQPGCGVAQLPAL